MDGLQAALGVFEEFVRILAWTKLSSHPTHATILKAENLGKRLQNLKHDAQIEFANLMRKCGLKFNDQERDILFNSFDLDNQRSLDFAKFSKEVRCILSPRKKAIVRTLKSFESSNIGAISISDLIRRAELQNPSRGAGSKLEETLNLIREVQKRLDDTTGSKGGEPKERHLVSPHVAGSHGTRSRARVGSQEVSISSPESLSASDTYQERPADINDVPQRREGRRWFT
jgi:Ca2+-binding EF-hand superfamily protein